MSKKVKLSKVGTAGLFAALAAGQSLGLPYRVGVHSQGGGT